MPTTLTSTSNYVGKDAGLGIIGPAFKEADTIAKGAVTFAQNVNYDIFIRKIQYTNGKQDYACGFTPAGSVVLTERQLVTQKVKNDIQVCKETFRNQWSQDLMGPSAWNLNAPADILGAITENVLKDTAEDTDSVIWSGSAANAGEWDGFTTLFASDGDVIIASDGTTVNAAVSKSNVLAAFENAFNLVPIALRRKPLMVAISPDVELALTQLLISNGASNGLGMNANTGLQYGKYALTTLNGLPANTILIYEKSNLVFGTGLLGDHNNFQIVDEDSIGLMTGQIRGKMVYNGGCQYANPAEIVWYVTTVA